MLSFLALTLAAAPRSSDSDLLDWIVKIVAGLVFIGIPLIKGILQSRVKMKEQAPKSDPRTARGQALEGRRLFDELMRGGPTLAPPPISRLPRAAPPKLEDAAREISARAEQRAPVAPQLVEIQEIPGTPLTGAEFEAEEGASEAEIIALAERRPREELRRQESELRTPEEIARAEYAASSSLRERVEPVPVEVFGAPALQPPSSPATSESARRWLGGGSGADRRAALRRALVLNEVLGRPVAARDGREPSMPVGLRG